jgi:hypothetical protein
MTYGFFDYIKKLLIVLFAFYFLTFFASDSEPIFSLISLSINLLICLNICCYLFFKNPKWNIIISFFFILKIFIGVIHYLYFFDSSYFSSGNFIYLNHEYLAVYEHIQYSVDYKKDNGIFAFFQKIGGVTHQEIWSFISIPFVYYGKFFMNIAPLNSFFASLTTLNLLLISKYYYAFSPKKLYYVLIISSLFPITLISSLFWRDVVGVYLISLGFILILLSKKNIVLNIISILFSSFLFYSYRTLYALIILFMSLLKYIKVNFITISLSLLLTLYIGYYIFINYSIQYITVDDLASIYNYNILSVLIKFPLGFIGPFPWNQFFDNAIFSYQIQENIQAIFNLTFLYFFVKNFKAIISQYRNDLIFQTSFLLILTGLINPFMHLVYVSFAFIYLIPFLANYTTLKNFLNRFLLIGILLFTFNIFYILFFQDGLNLSSLWK